MAKKKKLKKEQINLINMIVACAAALFGIVAIVMMFVTSMKIDNTQLTFTGAQLTFGYSNVEAAFGGTVTTPLLKFSFMNLLTYLLVIAGIVLVVLAFLDKGGKYIPFIAAACFLLAGIFFFLQAKFSMPTDELVGIIKAANLQFGEGFNVKSCMHIGAGAIVAGILSILSAGASLVKVFLK